jgi:hypothetical protein
MPPRASSTSILLLLPHQLVHKPCRSLAKADALRGMVNIHMLLLLFLLLFFQLGLDPYTIISPSRDATLSLLQPPVFYRYQTANKKTLLPH